VNQEKEHQGCNIPEEIGHHKGMHPIMQFLYIVLLVKIHVPKKQKTRDDEKKRDRNSTKYIRKQLAAYIVNGKRGFIYFYSRYDRFRKRNMDEHYPDDEGETEQVNDL
jgi:hypothetical protein